MTTLPPLTVETLELDYGRLHVVRDDLIAGGTKRRVVDPILRRHLDAGKREFIYASPTPGYGQLALAIACRDLGCQATIFVPAAKELSLPTSQAQRCGAKIIKVKPGYLNVCQARARQYAAENPKSLVMPFGLDCEEVLQGVADLASRIAISPSVVWIAVGSGTIIRGLLRTWKHVDAHGVLVGKKTTVPFVTLHTAPEKFHQPARRLPPIPSVANYDAKVWQFLADRPLRRGTLWWNVAGPFDVDG